MSESFPGFVACLAIVQVLCGLSMISVFHSKFLLSTQITILYFLVMSCISTSFSYELVLEAVVLCGASCALGVWHSHRISFPLHIECILCAWPRTSHCSSRPRLDTSLSPSSKVRFIFLENVNPSLIDTLRMLTPSHPLPSSLRSRNDFSASVAVRIASFDIVLSDSYSLIITLLSLLALAWVVFLTCC